MTPIAELLEDERFSLKVFHENRDAWKQFSNATVKALEEVFHLEFIAKLEGEVGQNPPEHYLGKIKLQRLYVLGKHPNNVNIRKAYGALQTEVMKNREQ